MMETAQITTHAKPLPLAEARALAKRESWRERVLAYVTRQPHELLVFAYTPEYPDAGIQVPAGGIEPGETLEAAALREVLEETGLSLSRPQHLASFHMTREDKSQVWHYFHLMAPRSAPDHWTQQVSGGVKDKGMTFLCSFVPLAEHGLIVGHQYEAALPQLQQKYPSVSCADSSPEKGA